MERTPQSEEQLFQKPTPIGVIQFADGRKILSLSSATQQLHLETQSQSQPDSLPVIDISGSSSKGVRCWQIGLETPIVTVVHGKSGRRDALQFSFPHAYNLDTSDTSPSSLVVSEHALRDLFLPPSLGAMDQMTAFHFQAAGQPQEYGIVRRANNGAIEEIYFLHPDLPIDQPDQLVPVRSFVTGEPRIVEVHLRPYTSRHALGFFIANIYDAIVHRQPFTNDMIHTHKLLTIAKQRELIQAMRKQNGEDLLFSEQQLLLMFYEIQVMLAAEKATHDPHYGKLLQDLFPFQKESRLKRVFRMKPFVDLTLEDLHHFLFDSHPSHRPTLWFTESYQKQQKESRKNLEYAKEKLGDDIIGREELEDVARKVSATTGKTVEFLTDHTSTFPYSKTDIDTASKRGEILLLLPHRMRVDGREMPITLRMLHEQVFSRDPHRAFDRLIGNVPDNTLKDLRNTFFDEPIQGGWVFFLKNPSYLTREDSFDKIEKRRSGEESHLKGDGLLVGSALRLPSVGEAIFAQTSYWISRHKHLIAPNYTWTRNTGIDSKNQKQCIAVGSFFGSVTAIYFQEAKKPHEDLGACFLRSAGQ